jgi:hypothetical protein
VRKIAKEWCHGVQNGIKVLPIMMSRGEWQQDGFIVSRVETEWFHGEKSGNILVSWRHSGKRVVSW